VTTTLQLISTFRFMANLVSVMQPLFAAIRAASRAKRNPALSRSAKICRHSVYAGSFSTSLGMRPARKGLLGRDAYRQENARRRRRAIVHGSSFCQILFGRFAAT
jgi:hypothetical protein